LIFEVYSIILKLSVHVSLQGSTMPAKKFWPSLSVNSKKKKNCNPYFIVIMITVLIMKVIFWVVNFKIKIILSFLLHRMFTSGYLCTIALILFIHVGFLEYLSFKQFKLIVKMTRIESGVTIPKGLFTLYLNVKKVTANIFWPP
jgi:preprotein translocase subunit SecE